MAERELPAPEEPETDAQREVGVSNIAVQIHTKGLRDTGADNRSALVDASAQTSLPDAPPETPSKDEFQEVVSTDVDVAAKPQLESKQRSRSMAARTPLTPPRHRGTTLSNIRMMKPARPDRSLCSRHRRMPAAPLQSRRAVPRIVQCLVRPHTDCRAPRQARPMVQESPYCKASLF